MSKDTNKDKKPFAVIKSGGKQYKIGVGDKVSLEKLEGKTGDKLSIPEVLLVGNGDKISVGTPNVKAASVEAKIIDQHKGDKILVFKKRRRKGSKSLQGHRQNLTRVEVTAIKGA